MKLRAALLTAVTLLLAGCGFHMRGHLYQGSEFAFHSIYIKSSVDTPLIKELRASLLLNRIVLAKAPSQADLVLEIASENYDKLISALSGTGQVREYQLRYRVSLLAYDLHDNEWMAADEITQQRSMAYGDAQILAKEQEEAMIKKDMQSDVTQQIMRRLSRAKPHPVDTSHAP